jgi:hypothetical protein
MTIMMPRANMMNVIRRLGLTQGLKLCLDAGDEASYSGSGQTWSDVSGNGHHFYRGATSGSEGSDPTFNGTAGRRSAGEYFGFDGGDYCVLAAANPAWANNLHKDNAIFTLAAWVYFAGGVGIQGIISTLSSGGDTGLALRFITNQLQFVVLNSSSNVLNGSRGGLSLNAWHFVAFSMNEAANSRILMVDGSQTAASATYSSPSSGNATGTLTIGSQGGANQMIENGGRVGSALIWEGRDLNAGELKALFLATRGKFGI